MRRKDTQPLSTILDEILRTQQLDTKLQEVRLLEAWEKVLGSNMSAYTKEKYIKNKVLFVHVTSSVLRSELTMARQQLVEMLNNAAGTSVITDIVFR